MIKVHTLEVLQTRTKPVVLAAGFFDGVHIGHQQVLERARMRAGALGGEVWVLSFKTHPLKVLKPEIAPLLLTSTTHKLALLSRSGVDGCILLDFSRALADLLAEQFAQHLFDSAPTLREVIVGENWRFGAGAVGSPVLLAQMGEEKGIVVTSLPPYLYKGEVVSSSRVRQTVTCGQFSDAAVMLGRPFSVLGTVICGRAIGRGMGYPSANIDPHNEVLPPLGVYAVQARVGDCFHGGALNFGTRPTFDKDKAISPLLELHLIDFSGNLYAKDVEVFFIKRLRDEWYFASVEDLKTQIADDVIQSRRILGEKGLHGEVLETLCRGWELNA